MTTQARLSRLGWFFAQSVTSCYGEPG